MSKNVARSRSLGVGGRVIVEVARVGILRLVGISGASAACKQPRNREGGRDAFDNTFLAAPVSMNHPERLRQRPVPNSSGGEVQGPIFNFNPGRDVARDRTRPTSKWVQTEVTEERLQFTDGPYARLIRRTIPHRFTLPPRTGDAINYGIIGIFPDTRSDAPGWLQDYY